MKKYLVILAAAVAALFAACTKETPNADVTPAGMVKVELTASVEGMTKTTYDAAGKFSWTEGDQISVLCSDEKFYTFTAKTSSAKAVFVGEVPEGVTLGSQAFFPADEGHAKNTFNVPAEATLNGAGQAALPMVGDQLEDGSYSFMHCTGGYLFTVENIPADYTTVKFTVATSDLKLSGAFGVHHKTETTLWVWNADVAANETEKTYVRTVDVANGVARLYLPYGDGAHLWGTTTLEVVGYDANKESKKLLPATKLSGLTTYDCERAVVQPAKPIVLADAINWDADNVVTYDLPEGASSSRQVLKQIKYFADKDNINIRLVASAEKLQEEGNVTNYLTIMLYDTITGTTGEGFYGWWNDAKGNVEYAEEHCGTVTGTDLALEIAGNAIAVEKTEEGDVITWAFAIPRTANEILSNSEVYMGILSMKDWDATGAMPDKYADMLKVTLP